MLAHGDPRQCPAVFSGRWRADPDLPCSVEMKHVGLALSRTTDATQATAGARVSGAPLELAVRGHSLNVIEVLLRARATVEGRVMDGTPLFRRVDKTCFSRARDDGIDTEYKADEPSHAFISQVLGAILSPEICRILRTLACAGEYRLNFEKQQREELTYRLGCLMELGGSRGPDFRGNKKYEEKKTLFEALSDEEIKVQREGLEKAVRACHLYAYEHRLSSKPAPDGVGLISDKEETSKGRGMNKTLSKNKGLTGEQMAQTCLFLALCRMARLAAKQLEGMATPQGLEQGAAYVKDLVEAAVRAKTAHGCKDAATFDADVVIWSKELLGRADAAKAQANGADPDALSNAELAWLAASVDILEKEALADDVSEARQRIFEEAEKPRLCTSESSEIRTANELKLLGFKEGLAAAFIDPEAIRNKIPLCNRDPDPKLYLSYYDKACYGLEAERPAKGFDGIELAPASPVLAPTTTPAPPPMDPALTTEQQRVNEALHAEDPEAKAAREAKERAAAAERQRAQAKGEDDRRRKKAAKDAARKQAQERQRAEEHKRALKREKEAARNREKLRRTALWQPAKLAATRAEKLDGERLTKALAWGDLATHFGVQEAADAQLERDERPSMGAPGALNTKKHALGEAFCVYPVVEDEGLQVSAADLLVADRVRDWYALRATPQWRKRLLEVLAKLATGDAGAWCRGAHKDFKEYGLRVALLDDTMRLIWSATKAPSDGGLRALAWCCVREGSVKDSCEAIKVALDRRAGHDRQRLVESEAPFLTLGDDDVLIHPGKNRPMKLWTCEQATLAKMASGTPPAIWSPSLRLTTKEREARDETHAPAMILGRSGTGKTHCIVARIARDSETASDRLLFATRSKKLRRHVEEAVRTALLKYYGSAPAPQTVATPTYLDATAQSTSETDSLLPFLEAQLKPLPTSRPWHDRTPSRRRRFYRQDDPDDMEVRGRRSGMRYRARRDAEGLREGEDESSDDESDSDTEGVAQRRQAQKRTSTWDPSKFVEFAAFARWHRDECRVEGKPEPDTCWTQIKSFLKGSTEAFILGEPLSEEDYLNDAKWGGRRTLNMDRNARRNAYKVFRSYELFLSEGEKWDACDREVALVQRVLRDGFKPRSDNARPAPFDKAYVDEVQDMTQASLAVLLLAVGGDPQRLYCCVDTAQAIQDGVAFRFSDFRQAIYDLQLKVHTLSRQKGFNGARCSTTCPPCPRATRRALRSYGSSRRIIGPTPACSGPRMPCWNSCTTPSRRRSTRRSRTPAWRWGRGPFSRPSRSI